jgi:hypothetical protein
MIESILGGIGHYLWHSLFGWVGITGLIMLAAIGVLFACYWVTTYAPEAAGLASIVRKLAEITIVVCLCILYLYPKAYMDGATSVRAQWKAQEARAIRDGDTARAKALKEAEDGIKDPFDDTSDQ